MDMDSGARPMDDDASPVARNQAAATAGDQGAASAEDQGAASAGDQGTAAAGEPWVQAPPPPPGDPGGQYAGSYPGTSVLAMPEDSRTWALGAHVSALLGGFLGGLPAFVGPLVVWMTRRDTDPFAAEHGRQALNFNISVALYAVALIMLTVVTFGFGLILAVPLGIALGGFWLVASVMAAVKAGNGEPFHYPVTIPFVN